ncbi:uncharacterized protein MELLADRAFT_78994 [Melampsora larici-populina 98AG31]|uniref:Uncharacterized protein n=1 Tax=Melampsora larici-populina (strain 98AG31 / pathotype 3-4-7) TaxID=747676 RepID=F4S1G8_MELLP|nr:uncharacterized protein MELLADRAFT_78994 [Melampsora larici-populina 98AG31]EGG01563.1 hypothetical protein MELLADRAFT_78994 [Melampsora larici-populina 98AG31]
MAPSAVNLTPDERTAYAYLFSKADTEQIGVLVGEKAVAFFSHSKLPPTILGEIWQLADQDNAGFLTRPQFDIALRLIGKAQRGIPINSAAISTPGPLCRLEGFTIPGIAVPSSPLPSVSAPPAAKAASSVQDPLYIIPESDKTKYVRMFMNAGPNDGLLDGEKARDIFIKSQLSFEKLGQIWTLSDTQSRGSLSVGDFSIAMHLIQLCMSGRLATLPAQLPPSLMESARSPVNPALVRALSPQMTGQPSQVLNHSTGSQRQATLNSSIRPQYTGQHAAATMPPLASSSQALSASATFPPQAQWDISPAELAQSNVFFEQLDPTRQGFITGDRAVPFMMESKLPGETLAQIWDLADIRGEGQLTREEFAVAMRLIQDTLAGANESLPTQLPVSMIPPSLRRASDTTNDLLSLMDDHEPTHTASPVATMAPISAQNTGQLPQSSILSAQRTGASVIGSMSSVLSPPTSSSGMNFNAQAVPRQFTGQANTLPSSLEDSGARLGNLHTQVASTDNALTQLRTEHGRLEGDIGSTSEQIRTLETKLSTSRAAHQTESRLVETLRAKQTEQRTVVKQLTEEVIRAESELSALKMEKSQIEGTVLRDKEDIRDMKKKMAELQEQTQQIRTALESLKKDSRLQKGLVAITKKQVSTIEGQKDQATKELAGLQGSIPGATDSTTTRSLTPVPSVTSPSESVSTITKSTNPFASMFLSKSPQPIEQSPTGSNFGQERAISAAKEPDPFATSLESSRPTEQPHEENHVDSSTHTEKENPPAIGFDEAFEPNESTSTSTGPPVSSPSNPAVRPTINAPGLQPSQAAQPRGDDDDLSSDEEEVEEATGSKLLSSSTTLKPQSSMDLKFPPLSDGEFYATGSDETHQSHRPSTLVQAGDAFYSARSGSFGGNFGSPSDAQHPESSDFDSTLDTKPNPSAAKPSGFGDDLDVSDFATDFGPEAGKATTATMEDFDSAFANLPPPSKVTDQPTEAVGNGAGESQDTFDNTFGDDFVTKPSTGAPVGFDDAFANFNDHFTAQPTQTSSIANDSNEVDPFGGSSTSSLPPHLPPRNPEKNDQDLPRDDDNDGVKQICAMGFPREVAIEALKKDEGDVERALNHLLGV